MFSSGHADTKYMECFAYDRSENLWYWVKFSSFLANPAL